MNRQTFFTVFKVTVLLVLTGILIFQTSVSYAQAPIQITEQTINSSFRRNMSALLHAEHQIEITNIEFFYRTSLDAVTLKDEIDFDPGTQVQVSYNLNRLSFSLPPGAEIEYWWRLTDADGNTLKTEPALYLIQDNRFEFKTLENDRLTVYWYNGSQAFGQALYQQANDALDRLEQDLNVTVERPIKIFIYGNHRDLLNAISVGAREWTGGVAYSEHGVIVIGIAPDRLDWGLKAMTHELTHLVVHNAVDNPYGGLPTWLNEGIAVYNESPNQLDDEFQMVIDEAISTESFLTLRSISSGFPADAYEAQLAYSQSGAIFHFMIKTYGQEAVAKLLTIFAEGAVPDRAFREALGEDTWSLDSAFRESVGLPPLPNLPSSSESASTDTTAPQAASNKSQEAGIEPKATVQNNKESPSAANSNSNGLATGCFGTLLPFAALGLIITRKRKNKAYRFLGQ